MYPNDDDTDSTKGERYKEINMYNNLGELKSFIESQMKENKSCDTVAIAYETLEQKEFIASNYYVVSENEDNEGKFLMVKNESVFGTVEFEGKKYILMQNAFVDNDGIDGEINMRPMHTTQKASNIQ